MQEQHSERSSNAMAVQGTWCSCQVCGIKGLREPLEYPIIYAKNFIVACEEQMLQIYH